MKIVVVDGGTLNPDDLSWDGLEGLCDEFELYERTAPEDVVQRCRGAEIVITNKVVFDEKVIGALEALKYIGVTATGYNVVDVEAAAARGVVVTNVPVYGTRSVAQMVFALLLELTQHVGHHSRTTAEGKWSRCESFCYWDYPLIELAGLTMGIVGCGRIGRATARLAGAFGMNVIGYDVFAAKAGDSEIERVELDSLISGSDVISLHCPLTAENEGMVDARFLRGMKPTAFLINTSRGPLVNERELADALNAGRIAGAGLDVLSKEPPQVDNPLLKAKNCFVTPHIAWATGTARTNLMNTTVDNVRAFLAGCPQNVVS